MAERDFYVAPLGGYNAAGAIDATLTAERGQRRVDKMKEGAAEVMRSGNPDDIAAFMVQNPEMSKFVNEASKFRSEATKSSLLETAKGIYAGNNPADLLEKHIGRVDQEGGDPRESVAVLGQSLQDPAKSKEWAGRIIALYDQPAWSAIRESEGLGGPGGKPTKQKTGAFLVRHPETNEQMIAVGSYDTSTGTLQTETAGLGEGWEVLSKMGETGQEESVRKVEQKRGETTVTGEEARASDLITRGIASAESSATIRRALDLLDTVETGGIDNANLAAKRFFGVEGADEGELSGALGKAVLSQLRETFGAAFTQEEGNRLIRIEAGFGKSPATNKRLLKQSLRIAERTANRARKAAVKRKDQATVDDIDDLMSFSLSVEGSQAQPSVQPQQQQPPSAVQPAPQYKEGQKAQGPNGEMLIFRNGNWGAM